jgi:hypothetical protein
MHYEHHFLMSGNKYAFAVSSGMAKGSSIKNS